MKNDEPKCPKCRRKLERRKVYVLARSLLSVTRQKARRFYVCPKGHDIGDWAEVREEPVQKENTR